MLIEGRGGERILAGEYGQPYVVVAIAEPDAATKRLNVTLVGIDAVGPIHLKRSYKVFDGDTGYAMELAAVVGQGVLEGRWKSFKTGAGAAAYGEQVAIEAQYCEPCRVERHAPAAARAAGRQRSAGSRRNRRRAPASSCAFPAAAPRWPPPCAVRACRSQRQRPGWVLRSGY